MKRKIILTEHIPGLDDYDLKPHYDLDWSKAKPNRFAGHVLVAPDGKRVGAGRKPLPHALTQGKPIVRKTVTLTQPDLTYLRKLDANVSRAIRKLIAAAK